MPINIPFKAVAEAVQGLGFKPRDQVETVEIYDSMSKTRGLHAIGVGYMWDKVNHRHYLRPHRISRKPIMHREKVKVIFVELW